MTYQTTPRLTRSSSDKMLAGVAGGIARYLAVDPVLIRLGFVLLAFTGISLFLYPLLWLIMPSDQNGTTNHVFVAGGPARQPRYDPMTGMPLDPEQEIPINNVDPTAFDPASAEATAERRTRALGTVLLGFGILIGLKTLVPTLMPLLVPALLIGVGVFLLQKK